MGQLSPLSNLAVNCSILSHNAWILKNNCFWYHLSVEEFFYIHKE